jgi:hypothetical protein
MYKGYAWHTTTIIRKKSRIANIWYWHHYQKINISKESRKKKEEGYTSSLITQCHCWEKKKYYELTTMLLMNDYYHLMAIWMIEFICTRCIGIACSTIERITIIWSWTTNNTIFIRRIYQWIMISIKLIKGF